MTSCAEHVREGLDGAQILKLHDYQFTVGESKPLRLNPTLPGLFAAVVSLVSSGIKASLAGCDGKHECAESSLGTGIQTHFPVSAGLRHDTVLSEVVLSLFACFIGSYTVHYGPRIKIAAM